MSIGLLPSNENIEFIKNYSKTIFYIILIRYLILIVTKLLNIL